MLSLLTQTGLSPSAKEGGRNTLMLACHHGNAAAVQALTGAYIWQSYMQALKAALPDLDPFCALDTSESQEILDQSWRGRSVCSCCRGGSSTLKRDQEQETIGRLREAVYWSVLHSQAEEHLAIKDSRGMTALAIAAAAASPACVKLLLDCDTQSKHLLADVGSDALAAAMGGDGDSAAGLLKPGNAALTADRLSCAHLLIKAKCGMTQAQHAHLAAVLESLPASQSTCKDVRKLSRLQKEGLIRPCQKCPLWGRWAKCGACKRVSYCSLQCQQQHWSAHRASCGADSGYLLH